MADARDTSVLEGTLERVVFQNAENSWTVARLAPESGGTEVTVVGTLVEVPAGTPLRLEGKWVTDPRYGRQFKIESFQPKVPQTLLGIQKYLGSDLIPGIGPELAKRIVERFGHQTLDVISGDPGKLETVDGIGAQRAKKIAAAWAGQKEIRDVMVFLQGHGVTTAYAVRIYKRYGADSIRLVRENPYRLALDIWGIGFKTADAIAQNMGIAQDAPERLEAGLLHALGQMTENGHVHTPEQPLLETAGELLGAGRDALGDALDRLVESGLVISEPLGNRGTCYSLVALWESEHEAAEALAVLVDTPARAMRVDVGAAINVFQSEAGISLAEQQRQAVEAAVTDKCVVITGGPGVGKTTIVRAIVGIFLTSRRALALAAPTGRAAKRLTESTMMEATTIHRLLEYQPQSGGFQRNAENPLEVDAVIIDETSMVDIALFRALLVALPANAQLILVGDIDQLPSVGPGSVLGDVIRSGAATVVRLTEIFRQAAESEIVVNAHKINSGQPPNLRPPPGREATRSDFYYIERDDPILARETIVELVAERIPKRFGFDPVTEIQVLTPMHRGELGTVAINAALQERLNPAEEGERELKRADRCYRAGDKVMQIKNDYDKSVFNGDIGVIRAVRREAPELQVQILDGRRIEYERGELDQLVHAFAVSVHKSQGSEYPAIVLPLMTQHYMMLQRNLLYTAITRGKKLVVLVGSRRAVNMAVRNDKTRARWTWLAERIRQARPGQ